MEKQKKTVTLIFRATKNAVKSVDRLARLAGVTRSEALRRLVPDFGNQKSKGGRQRA